jgi:outer membrane lipoprotein SlyB
MKTHTNRSSYFHRAGAAGGVLTLLITGIAVILFSTAGIARIVGWGPNSTGDSGDTLALDQSARVPVTNEVRVKARCPECGVIVSVREIERHDQDSDSGAAGGATAANLGATGVKWTRNHEITVRLSDGSSRVIDDAKPARWRSGEHVIVIDGANPSNK